MTTVINLVGAPGLGKSTFGAGLFSFMKKSGYNVEYVDEYAKRKVYENNPGALECQPYIFGNQLYKLHILNNKVDYIINDSPILLSVVYNKDYPESFNTMAIEIFKSFNNINLLMNLSYPNGYQDSGRVHSEIQSYNIHNHIISLMRKNDIDFHRINQYKENYQEILDLINNR